MNFNEKMLLLYAVTDQAWVGNQTLLEQIEDALKGGATIVQLREKKMDENSFVEEAIQVRDLCHKYHVTLWTFPCMESVGLMLTISFWYVRREQAVLA